MPRAQPPDLGAHALFCRDAPPDEIRALDVPADDEGGEGDDSENFDLSGDLDFEDEGRLGPIERLEREIQAGSTVKACERARSPSSS